MKSFWDQMIIIQAGGKGSRLGHLTANRPKCLVPIENRPMIFHLFQQFPDANFIIIGDTHYDVLEKYLAVFATVKYRLVRATGLKGTLAGLSAALAHVPQNQPFMYIWSDLVLPMQLHFPQQPGNYIGIGNCLPCRWKFENGEISEQASDTNGIAGLFLIEDKEILGNLPPEGQFVKYISAFPQKFRPWFIDGLREYGLLEKYEAQEKPICRPFNSMEFTDSHVIKRPITPQGEELASKERAWYRHIQNQGFSIPEIMQFEPLKMGRVEGKTIADSTCPSLKDKENILYKIIVQLKKLHEFQDAPYHEGSYRSNYIEKTFKRLKKIRELVPFADHPHLLINGRKCRNPLFHKEKLAELFERYKPDKFNFIHGDPTFSNIMLDTNAQVIFIDPRGYFGDTHLFGDKAYDYAKLYYSVVGNYDNFNKKFFRLKINSDGILFYIESSGWENLADHYFRILPPEMSPAQIRLIHAIIWLSLTTYAWEDYDSICGAFYNGTLLFEESLNEHNL